MKALLLTTALIFVAAPAFAEIHIQSATAFETSEGAQNGAALVTIHNDGTTDDKLVSASAPVAATTQIHEMAEENGVMKMRQVEAVTVKAGETVVFKPDGYHVMLMGLKEPLKAGGKFPLSLKFEKAGELKADVDVKSRAAPAAVSHEGH